MAHTVGQMRKWSCQNKQIPAASQIKSIHIYDFDNTLFHTPLPNPQLWTGPTAGCLATQDYFINGGWWHDPRILEATGEGIEKEEPRAWEGWWNELIVNLVELSMKQKDALTVLLTGRGEHNFADLIKRMVKSRNLEFDMICLKAKVGPNNVRFTSTMQYKQSLLEELLYTYKEAEDVKVYEDRIKHVRGFKEFFEKVNRAIDGNNTPVARKPVNAQVIHVAEGARSLDPVVEASEVQRMINLQNQWQEKNQPDRPRLLIKRTIFFTGYLLAAADTAKLLTLVPQPQQDTDMKYLASNIMITPRPATKSILDKVGGMGAKHIWQVNGLGVHQNSIWAARVTPIPPSATYFTENPHPIIVLACRKSAKPMNASQIQNWQSLPSEQQFVFETTVGEKVQLRVDREVPGETEYDSLFASAARINNKRKNDRDNDDDHRKSNSYRGRDGHRGGRNNNTRNGDGGGDRGGHRNGTRGGRGGNRGGGGRDDGGRGGRGKGRGGYKSLDDMGNGPTTNRYDSDFPALGNERQNRGGGGMYDDGDGGLPYGR